MARSDVWYSHCCNRGRVNVSLSVGIDVTVDFPSNKVCVVIGFALKRWLGRQSHFLACCVGHKLAVLASSKSVLLYVTLHM